MATRKVKCKCGSPMDHTDSFENSEQYECSDCGDLCNVYDNGVKTWNSENFW